MGLQVLNSANGQMKKAELARRGEGQATINQWLTVTTIAMCDRMCGVPVGKGIRLPWSGKQCDIESKESLMKIALKVLYHTLIACEMGLSRPWDSLQKLYDF